MLRDEHLNFKMIVPEKLCSLSQSFISSSSKLLVFVDVSESTVTDLAWMHHPFWKVSVTLLGNALS